MIEIDTHTGFEFRRDGSIVTVVLSNGRANTVDPELIESLIESLPTITEDPTVRCIVLRGEGRIFVGGADLNVMLRLDPDTYKAMRRWTEVQRLVELAPKPVIAALNGHTLGGGAEMALACDLRIISGDALFGFPETRLGIFPGAGGSQRLPRLVGPHVAKRLIFDGARLSAQEALAVGLVDMVVEPHQFDEVVAAEAVRLAALPTATLGLVKRAIMEGAALPLDEALQIEEHYVLQNLKLEDAREGISAFLEKRPPTFSGR